MTTPAAARRLATLAEVTRIFAASPPLRVSAPRALERLRAELDATAVFLALAERGGDLALVASVGLKGSAAHARFAPGEGIAGRVARSGRPVAVPRLSEEPVFADVLGLLSARRRGRDLSYVCVPVAADGPPVGVLAAAVPFEIRRDLGETTLVLEVAASTAAQALRTERALEAERSKVLDERRRSRDELAERYRLESSLVGRSHAMRDVFERVGRAAASSTTVLLRGESGTGKELVAHALHFDSPRAAKPFVKVACAALPESLIESELFGYEPGAFTDARAAKKGRFELAHGGTLFLDEVGELSAATQVKLLRVLQEREFERLGGTHTVKVDVRLVAATNRDLEAALRTGTFREDLYYRLNVLEIFLPPLRERKDDVLLLADHFVEKYAVRHGRDVRRLSTSAIDMLTSYHWPGNVRELENVVERAVLVSDGGVIHAHHLPPSLQTAEVSGTLPRESLESAVAALEKDLILDALKIARGNRARAARLLRTTERILVYKARKLGIDGDRFRA